MTTRQSRAFRRSKLAAAGLALLFGQVSCGLDEVQVPELSGPSELGFSLKLDANPDVLTADGFSTAVIVATARGPNSEPLAGRTILFALSDLQGGFADIGTLYDITQRTRLGAAEATAVTGSDGIAQVVYTAPARTDATANTSVVIQARPVGTDFNGAQYRSVRIELRSAEPRLFPVTPGALLCNFVVEAPLGAANCTDVLTCTVRTGAQVLFQDASSAASPIVRYEWFFGDGTGVDYHVDTNHVFRTPGGCALGCTFTVTHRVTDSTGAADACQATITVQDTVP